MQKQFIISKLFENYREKENEIIITNNELKQQYDLVKSIQVGRDYIYSIIATKGFKPLKLGENLTLFRVAPFEYSSGISVEEKRK
jgi:hypothetical protein